MKEVFFHIPNDEPEVIRTLVQAIPAHWSQMSGTVFAPHTLREKHVAHTSVGFEIYACGTVTVVNNAQSRGRDPWQPGVLQGFLFQAQMPAFITFNPAHKMQCAETNTALPNLIEIATEAVQQGYCGELSFHLKDRGSEGLWVRAGCRISFERKGTRSLIALSWWQQACGDTHTDILPIYQACESLRLPQIEYKQQRVVGV